VRDLRRRIAEQDMDGRVILLGTLTPEDVSVLLNQSHVLAVPAWFEALGIVFLEAMRAGLPVIASSAGGAREIITHGREGFLVPPGEVSALADSLSVLLTDRHESGGDAPLLDGMSPGGWLGASPGRTPPGTRGGRRSVLARARRFLVELNPRLIMTSQDLHLHPLLWPPRKAWMTAP
jgi:glycosyltransferase involved in cell wall biosynthesis